jgi:hypothetical protein
MRVASHGGTRPPWRGKSALPVRLAIARFQFSADDIREIDAGQDFDFVTVKSGID